jgi:hypothetical protein
MPHQREKIRKIKNYSDSFETEKQSSVNVPINSSR